MDLVNSAKSARRLTVTASVMALGLIGIVLSARSLNEGVVYGLHGRLLYAILNAVPFVAVTALLVLSRFVRWKWTPLLVSAVLVVESLLLFGAPSVAAEKHVDVDMAPIHFLQTHEGQYRFFDFDVLTPNWAHSMD